MSRVIILSPFSLTCLLATGALHTFLLFGREFPHTSGKYKITILKIKPAQYNFNLISCAIPICAYHLLCYNAHNQFLKRQQLHFWSIIQLAHQTVLLNWCNQVPDIFPIFSFYFKLFFVQNKEAFSSGSRGSCMCVSANPNPICKLEMTCDNSSLLDS